MNDRPSEPRLRIYLLGRFEVGDEERVLIDGSWSRRKAQALIKLLACHDGHALHREEVLEALWPDLEPAAAANNLYKNLHYIRSHLSTRGESRPLVTLRGDIVLLQPGAEVDSDRFRELAHAAIASADEAVYEQAARIYRGDLLPEDVYEEWTEPEREELRRLHAQLLLGYARLRESRGLLQGAIETLHALLRSDQLNEEAHRLLISLNARSGSRHRALRQFQLLRDLLAQELAIAPSAETQALYDELVGGGRPALRGTRPDMEGREAPQAAAPGTAPAYGRDRDLDRAEAWLEAALSGNGTTLLVRGEAGIGKSHFVRHLLATAADSSALVLQARCYDLESSIAYQPFRDILRQASDSAGAAGFIQHSLHVRRLLAGPERPEEEQRDPRVFQSELFEEVHRLFQALARRQPLAVWLDDLHEADDDSMSLVHFLARRIPAERFLLVGSYRAEEPRGRTRLADLAASLRRDGLARELDLEPLDQQSMTLLVDHLMEQGAVESQLMQEVVGRAAGNPFFASELVHTFVQEGWARNVDGRWLRRGSGQAPLPGAVHDLLDIRLRRLSPMAQEELQLMAAFGRETEYSLLRATLEGSERQALDALDECIEAFVIEETPRGYRFRHDLLREAVYSRLTRARRQVLHRRLGRALEAASPDPLAGPEVETIARHLAEGDEPPAAIPYLIESGRRAAAVYANEQAVAYYERALALAREYAGALEGTRHAALLESLADLERRLGGIVRSVELFDGAHGLYVEAGDQEGASRSRGKAALGHLMLGDAARARELIAATLQDVTDKSPMMVVARTHYLLAQLHWHSGENKQALEAAERALIAADSAGDSADRAQAIEVMALACHSLGDWQRGVELELERQALGATGYNTDEAFEAHL